MRVLMVEDDPAMALLLRLALEREGHQVCAFDHGEPAIEMARTWEPDAVLLDFSLPEIEGSEVARRMRTFSTVPIIMVTGRGEVGDRITGLEMGADDYVVKPFSIDELLARIRAVVRRAAQLAPAGTILNAGELVMDVSLNRVLMGALALDLTTKEFEILRILMSQPGRIVPRDELVRAVWGVAPGVATNSLDVHMSWLRGKLGDDPKQPRYIETVRGKGFRFIGS